MAFPAAPGPARTQDTEPGAAPRSRRPPVRRRTRNHAPGGPASRLCRLVAGAATHRRARRQHRWQGELRGAALNQHLDFSSTTAAAISLRPTAEPPPHLAARIDIAAISRGRTSTSCRPGRGEVYAELDYADLAGWRAWVDTRWPCRKQRRLRLWRALPTGALSTTADVRLADVRLQLRPDLPELDLLQLEGRVAGIASIRASGREASDAGHRDGLALAPTDLKLAWRVPPPTVRPRVRRRPTPRPRRPGAPGRPPAAGRRAAPGWPATHRAAGSSTSNWTGKRTESAGTLKWASGAASRPRAHCPGAGAGHRRDQRRVVATRAAAASSSASAPPSNCPPYSPNRAGTRSLRRRARLEGHRRWPAGEAAEASFTTGCRR